MEYYITTIFTEIFYTVGMSRKDSEDGDRAYNSESITVSLPRNILQEWDEDVEESDWSSRSGYIRDHVQVGRRQMAALHPAEQDGDSSELTQKILQNIPDREEVKENEDVEAPDINALLEAVLDPMEKDILKTVDRMASADQIENSAVLGGYVKK